MMFSPCSLQAIANVQIGWMHRKTATKSMEMHAKEQFVIFLELICLFWNFWIVFKSFIKS